MNSQYPVLIFLVPFVGALLCAVTGWWYRGAARVIALASLGAMTLLALAAGVPVFETGSLSTHLGGWAPPIGIELVLDPLSLLMALMTGSVSLVVLASARTAVRAELEGRETGFYALSLLLVAGLTGMVVTGDLFNMFVHLEVASLSAYALTAAGRPGAARAGLNYLLIGSLGASFYLLGVGFIYAGTGTLNMADAFSRLADAPPRLAGMGLALIVAGLAVKMALFPLHGWMPSAYAATTTTAAALMAALVTKISAYALLRILFWVYGSERLAATPFVMAAIGWAGAAALVAGGFYAFMQSDLRRLFAYSSVSQMGLIAIGLSVANSHGLTGATLHIFNDALMKGVLFLAAGALLVRSGVTRVDQLAKLRGRAPWTTVAIAVSGISLIGLPPLAGFFGKWYVLLGALESGRWFHVGAIALGTALTAAYVFRLLEPLLFGKPVHDAGNEGVTAKAEGGPTLAGMLLLTAFIVLAGVFNGPLAAMVRASLPSGLAP